MNLTTATPLEIDTALYALYLQQDKAEQRVESAKLRIHQMADSKKVYTRWGSQSFTWSQTFGDAVAKVTTIAATDNSYVGNNARNALEALDKAEATVSDLLEEANDYNDEYRRRPWTRAFLVQASNGHVHSSMSCSTCFPTTRYAWMVDYAGKDESEIVEAAGEAACTICYPSAPVGVLSRPTRMFGPQQLAAQAARDKRAEATAKKIAKGLTADGSPLVVNTGLTRFRETFKTEQAASQWVVGQLADAERFPQYYSIDTDMQDGIDQVLYAIAAKHDMTMEELRADIDRKVVAKLKRDGYHRKF